MTELSQFATDMTAAFAQYSITFADLPPLGSNRRVSGLTPDEQIAVEVIVTTKDKLAGMSLVAKMTAETAATASALAVHLPSAFVPLWKDGPRVLADAMRLLVIGGTFTTEQIGTRITLTYLTAGLFTMKLEAM